MRRLVAGLGCTPAEALALAMLVVGAVAVLGVLWLLAQAGRQTGNASEATPTPAADEEAPLAGPGLEADYLVVHVAGEVAGPGLYKLPAGARVADALEVAGGPTDEALTAALNLARVVSDGEQLYVPGPEEAGPGGDGTRGQPGGPAGESRNAAPGSSAWRSDGRLDLNRATTDDLEELDGIGEVLTPSAGYARYSSELAAKADARLRRQRTGPAVAGDRPPLSPFADTPLPPYAGAQNALRPPAGLQTRREVAAPPQPGDGQFLTCS